MRLHSLPNVPVNVNSIAANLSSKKGAAAAALLKERVESLNAGQSAPENRPQVRPRPGHRPRPAAVKPSSSLAFIPGTAPTDIQAFLNTQPTSPRPIPPALRPGGNAWTVALGLSKA